MKSLIFMMRKTMKNILRDLVNHPAKLVAYLLLAVIFLFAVFSSAIMPDNGAAGPQKFADPRILRAVFLGLMMLFSVCLLYTSLSSDHSLFIFNSLSNSMFSELFVLCYHTNNNYARTGTVDQSAVPVNCLMSTAPCRGF